MIEEDFGFNMWSIQNIEEANKCKLIINANNPINRKQPYSILMNSQFKRIYEKQNPKQRHGEADAPERARGRTDFGDAHPDRRKRDENRAREQRKQ